MMKMNDEKFEDFLCEKMDEIDNAVFDAFAMMAPRGEEPTEWDQHYIGQIADHIQHVMQKNKMHNCYPSYVGEDEVPCYRSEDRCEWCPFEV